MFLPDFFTALNLTSGENPNLFPFPFKIHLIFCIVGFFFFIIRFIYDKKPYQAILALAIPFSMTLWLSDSRVWFYTVGIIELVLILAASISSIVYNIKHPQPKEAEKAENTSNTSDSTNEAE